MYEKHTLADIDGRAHIACETSDYSKPELITHHWPTNVRTADVLDYLGVTDLDAIQIRKSLPGEYYVTDGKPFSRSLYLSLVDGGRTESVKMTTRPYPRPKRARQAEYRDGRWYKLLAGKWVAA